MHVPFATASAAGTLAILWTVRAAMILYAAALALKLRAGPWRVLRWCWTVGCLLYLAHVISAFAFYHGWSHAAAYRHTAEETAAVTGLHWGGGLWFNYIFTAVWTADAAWWWLGPKSYAQRPWGLSAAVHAFMLFVVFNATVVFAAGPTRWLGVAAAGLLAWLWLSGRGR